MIWVVSGPSCCGKSTFIQSQRALEVTGLSRKEKVVFPFQKVDNLITPTESAFFHYNILRPLWIILRRHLILYISLLYPIPILWKLLDINKSTYDFVYKKWNYRLDLQWVRFLKLAPSIKAVVLVADESILIKRVLKRKEREREWLADVLIKRVYPRDRWALAYSILNLPLIYSLWCRELNRAGIEFILLDAETYQELA